MVAAVRVPGVHILAHPRGRQSGTRAGIVADWDRVFAECASAGVAIELDGSPARQDLDHTIATRALAAGCVFALDSDAHSVAELAFADYAIAHARLAEIPADRIVNCWEPKLLDAWLTLRKGGRGKRSPARQRE
jgi:putative hydrolase